VTRLEVEELQEDPQPSLGFAKLVELGTSSRRPDTPEKSTILSGPHHLRDEHWKHLFESWKEA
jgi:hypothetical protein